MSREPDVTYHLDFVVRPDCNTCGGMGIVNSGGCPCPDCKQVSLIAEGVKLALDQREEKP